MDRRVSNRILPNQFVPLIHVPMVFVARVIVAMLHRSASFCVFLPPLGRLPLPRRWTCAAFDHRVFVVRVALFRHGDQRGIDQVPPTRV